MAIAVGEFLVHARVLLVVLKPFQRLVYFVPGTLPDLRSFVLSDNAARFPFDVRGLSRAREVGHN